MIIVALSILITAQAYIGLNKNRKKFVFIRMEKKNCCLSNKKLVRMIQVHCISYLQKD